MTAFTVDTPWGDAVEVEAIVLAAVVATAAWLLLIALIYVVRRPPQPDASPPTMDLPPEPPAVANFLTHDFRVTPDAVPATLLDLGARGVVAIDEIGPGACIVRVDAPSSARLLPFEDQVLEHVGSRAIEGVVPAPALTTGPRDDSSRWRKRFKKSVIVEAKVRRLSRDLWDETTAGTLGLLAIVPGLLYLIALGFWGAFTFAISAFVVVGILLESDRQRETPAGMAAASRWLGVKDHLEENETFPTLSPAAIAIWDRYLAYGAALGVAAGAVRALPLGAESDYRAWSSFGRRWRQVRVRYRGMRPLWGWHPGSGTALGVVLVAVPAFLASLIARADTQADPAIPEEAASRVLTVVYVALGAVALFGLYSLVMSVPDLFSRRYVTGQVLRLRIRGSESDRSKCTYYVALDDGTRERVKAWRVRKELYQPLRQYETVTATVTPNLHFVRAIRPL